MIDASSDEHLYHRQAVEDVLDQIGAARIERVEVFNKCDLLSEEQKLALSLAYPEAVLVSAATGEGLDCLVERIGNSAATRDSLQDVLIPYSRGDLVALAHTRCQILSEEYEEGGTHLVMRTSREFEHTFKQFEMN